MKAASKPLRRVLIANRAEIAVRIARSCRVLGIESVAVVSDADRDAMHARHCDHVVAIGGESAADSYLRMDLILEAARKTGADAIHPGYGFLAENADFARAVQDAGLRWIGPPPEVIAEMGVKTTARRRMIAAKVPVVPGEELADGSGPEDWLKVADSVGYPVLVKAASGGGGKGMRAVEEKAALVGAIQAAQREAASAFGDPTVYLERLLRRPRHVEVQILADAHGNVVTLGERDCSIQRRHQKVIEEAPAPGLPAPMAQRMHAAALEAARSIGYEGAGTVEMLWDGAEEFFFLEMNTRLQVEHPVTELTMGVDLVSWQLKIAGGESLDPALGTSASRGHAFEARLYAEDPAAGFLPQAGKILHFAPPVGPGVRVDAGVESGDSIGLHYDPMLAKICVWGADREEARLRLLAALRACALLGLRSNLPYLISIAEAEAFREARVHTSFLAEELPDWKAPEASEEFLVLAEAAAAALLSGGSASSGPSDSESPGLWSSLGPLGGKR